MVGGSPDGELNLNKSMENKNPIKSTPIRGELRKRDAGEASGSSKRKRIEDSGSIWDIPKVSSSWSRFLVIKSEDSKRPAGDLNIFQVGKGLRKIGVVSPGWSRLGSGDLLVEVRTSHESAKLLNAEYLNDLPIDVEAHVSLNRSRGVVKSKELEGCSEQDLVDNIDGVIAARRVVIRRGEKEIKTHSWVLTFDSSKPSASLTVEFLKLNVRPFVPNPMRCFNCHRFGHSKDHCKREAVCPRCGKGGHLEENCSSMPRCPNCNGDHSATSKECIKWLEERAILEYKATHGGTFFQARKILYPNLPASIQKKTYAGAVRMETKISNTNRQIKPKSPAKITPARQQKAQTDKKGGDKIPTSNRFSLLGEEEGMETERSPDLTSLFPPQLSTVGASGGFNPPPLLKRPLTAPFPPPPPPPPPSPPPSPASTSGGRKTPASTPIKKGGRGDSKSSSPSKSRVKDHVGCPKGGLSGTASAKQ